MTQKNVGIIVLQRHFCHGWEIQLRRHCADGHDCDAILPDVPEASRRDHHQGEGRTGEDVCNVNKRMFATRSGGCSHGPPQTQTQS
jgi:hypothetical protein